MITMPPVLLPSSIILPPSSHCAFVLPKENLDVCLKKMLVFKFLSCICLMAGGLLVKRDVRMSHDVTSDRHTKKKIR